jgi:cell division protein FtsZ
MSGEPYAAASGHGASSAAVAMPEPEPEPEPVPAARAEEDSFFAPRPAEPEAADSAEDSGFFAEPDPFAEAALANAARREPQATDPRQPAPRHPESQEAARVSRPAQQPAMQRPNVETRTASPAPKRSGQSLFAKVTGAARALAASQSGEAAAHRSAQGEPAQPAPKPMPARSASPAQPERQAASQPHSSQPAPSRPAAAQGGSQPRLSGLDPAERIGHSQAEEDLLDIPAFLRRQAN